MYCSTVSSGIRPAIVKIRGKYSSDSTLKMLRNLLPEECFPMKGGERGLAEGKVS